MSCNENFGPPSKIGPPRLILAAKSGPPLPILVPPVKLQLVNKLYLDECIALLGAVKLILFATTNYSILLIVGTSSKRSMQL